MATEPSPPPPEREAFGLTTRFKRARPGSRPGVDVDQLAEMAATSKRVPITCIDYSEDRFEVRRITDPQAFIESRREPWVKVRWINVDGLDYAFLRALAIKYGLHPLAMEDVLDLTQRPKVESYTGQGGLPPHLFLIVRMLQLDANVLESEQISMFIGHELLITIQEAPGDIWNPIRQRIEQPGSRLRQQDSSYLAYALIDSIVDYCFPVLEHYGERLEDLEDTVLDRPSRETIHAVHAIKRELLLLRRAVWPMREVVNGLQREPHECMSDTTRIYLRDVYDHLIQIMDIIETYREVGTSLTETYMSAMSNRLSEVMKVLTVIGTIFIPLTFLAGVYGMNMPIPENKYAISYPIFWGVCIVIAVAMLRWFRKRGWL
jgi:magnesium transporter